MKRGRNCYARILPLSSAIYEAGVIIPEYRDAITPERWILEPRVYWASEGNVSLGLLRERVGPSLWAGDGVLVWKTTVSNQGQVAINAPGPVEMVEIENGNLSVQGRLVLGRTDGLQFHSRRSARTKCEPAGFVDRKMSSSR